MWLDWNLFDIAAVVGKKHEVFIFILSFTSYWPLTNTALSICDWMDDFIWLKALWVIGLFLMPLMADWFIKRLLCSSRFVSNRFRSSGLAPRSFCTMLGTRFLSYALIFFRGRKVWGDLYASKRLSLKRWLGYSGSFLAFILLEEWQCLFYYK